MGEVYRAHDARIGRDVAIKVLPASAAADADRLRRFEQETRATGLLNHPNILIIHDTGALPSGAPFIVTELLDGRTLRDELAGRALPPRKALDCAIQIVRGLSAAHAKGIVHRDLKPENLFVSADGRLKILDFGIAKLAAAPAADAETQAAPAGTGAGLVIGTTEYMSPEQARGEPVDHRSDLFAFGVILHEMLAGERPFAGTSIADRISAVLRDEPAALPAKTAGLLPGIDRIVRHCLEKDPARRFQSANDLLFDLEALASADAARSNAPGRRASPGWMPRALAAAVLVIAAGAVGVWLFRQDATDPVDGRRAVAAPRVTPFLASEAIEQHPAWSPAGNLIAYVSDADGNDDIWMSDPSGANAINLTKAFEGTDSVPAWSPDGQRLAFFSSRDGGGIFTMNALGGDVRKVVPIKPGVLYTFSLTWARDGSLVYTTFNEQDSKQVYRVGASGGVPSCLTCGRDAGEGGRAGELSPSGELLVYQTGEMGARGALLVLQIASGHVTRVLEQADMPSWSADGTRILFISAKDGTPDLWQVEVDPASGARAGDPERLTSGLAVSDFAVAPAGRQILAVTEKGHGNLWSFPATSDPITSMASGEQWTAGQFVDMRGRFLPDGRGVLFQSNRRGSLDIWTLASPGAAPARLTTGAGTEHRPRISPDGEWIAFDLIDATGQYVHVMRRDGTGVRIPDPGWRDRFSMMCCADWSPDGTRLAMHVDRTRTAIVRIDRSTGAALETTVLDLPGVADEYHRWSPNGRHIVYEAVTEGTWDLWVVRADGSNPHRLTSLPGGERAAAWHPRLPFIYFGDNLGAIWRVPIDADGRATGAPQPWLQLSGRMKVSGDGLDFSRDGERVLVTLMELARDIWLIELDGGKLSATGASYQLQF
jgi:Tol biopolymer transport system component